MFARNAYLATGLRFVLLAAVQVLVLSNVGIREDWGAYAQGLLYPLVILLLPVGTPTVVVLLVAFVLGLCVDVPLGTIGIHTAALVLTAYVRSVALALLEPREGYTVNQSPTREAFGLRWFMAYAAVLMGVHTLAYFSVEAFTFVYFWQIMLRALSSFCISMLLILVYMLVFDPEA